MLTEFQIKTGRISVCAISIFGQECNVWPHVPKQIQAKRHNNTNYYPFVKMWNKDKGANKAYYRNNAVIFLGLPYVDKPLDIDQAYNRHHDNSRQHRLRQVVQKWGENKKGNDDHTAGEYRRHAGYCA